MVYPYGYVPKRGDVFGELAATGRREHRQGQNSLFWFSEVRCSHGNKRYVHVSSLKGGLSTSCHGWKECFLPKRGVLFGTLEVTGRTKVKDRLLAEVRCPHGSTRFVAPSSLNCGNTASCRLWEECRPKKGDRFGDLIATGKSEYQGNLLFLEVRCSHGNREFIRSCHLKSSHTTSCQMWEECVLPKKGDKFGLLTATGGWRFQKSRKKKGTLY